MPNPYFQFKQFTVYHDRCAMKVGTDGVLLGAWTNVEDSYTALDVGSGSGLISLMLAQRNNKLRIKAIDIDKNAFEQSIINTRISPFKTQIECKHTSLQDIPNSETSLFDLIVSNPPYFNQSLKSPDSKRSIARHTDTLPIEDLINYSSKLLNSNGRLSIIYPHHDKDLLIALGHNYGLYASRITNVYPTIGSQPKRILLEFSRKESRIFSENDLVIETRRHEYSLEFTELVKDFYLKM